VLDAARSHFVEHGYSGTRLRDVAATAGVDVALVHYFFSTKDNLFAAAMELPIDPAEVAAGLLDGPRDELAGRMLERFLGIWDAPGAADPLIALVRSASTHEPAAELLRGFIHHGVIGPLIARLEVDDHERRAALVASQILGLVLIRYVVRVEPLASDNRATVIAALEPAIAQHLSGPLG
jgi:AcrR family transcriptional regulator